MMKDIIKISIHTIVQMIIFVDFFIFYLLINKSILSFWQIFW